MGELNATPPVVTVKVLEEGDGVTTLGVAGELDVANVEPFEAALNAALERPGVESLVLDLADFAFIDSTGIGALLRTSAKGVRIELHRAAPLIAEIVDTAGLADMLHLERDH